MRSGEIVISPPSAKKTRMHARDKGSALFLILIAVALFAALSYAVTQSGRGGGTISKEDALIKASGITQYLALVRTTVTRMVMLGATPDQIGFSKTGTGSNDVFYSGGGGAVYQNPPSGIGNATEWGFRDVVDPTKGIFIKDIGTNTDVTGRDVLAGLGDITLAVCQELNRGLGLSNPPATNSAVAVNPPATYAINQNVIDAYPGQAFGCFWITSGYVYYHALIER